jgi:hypothetical protein
VNTYKTSAPIVAWRNKIGDRWYYCELDPREVHDNGKQTDALMLVSDHEEIMQGFRKAIAIVCEGFTLPENARKALETALYANWQPGVKLFNVVSAEEKIK